MDATHTDSYKVERSILGSAWQEIHKVGNLHAAQVFAQKRRGKGSQVRVVDTLLGRVVSAW